MKRFLSIIAALIALPAVALGQPSGLSGNDPVTVDPTSKQVKTPNSKIGFPDDFTTWYGGAEALALQLNSTGGYWRLFTSDDGASSELDLIQIPFPGSDIHILPTSGDLGVGSTSPAAKLTVRGPSQSQPVVEIRDSWNSVSSLAKPMIRGFNEFSGAISWHIGSGGAGVFNTVKSSSDNGATFPILLDHGGDSYFNGTGNLGVGLTSPTSIAGYKIVEAKGSSEGGRFVSNHNDAVYSALFSNSNSKGYVGTTSAHSFVILSDNTDRVTVNTSGNVGVGTANAAVAATGEIPRLFVRNPSNAGGILELSASTSTDNDQAGTVTFGNAANADTVNVASAQYSGIGLIRALVETTDSNAGQDSGGHLAVSTKPEAGVLAERMRVTSAGNVGIGTTSPNDFKLQAAGHVGPDADVTYDLGSSSKRWRTVYAETVDTPVGSAQQQLNSREYAGGVHFDGVTAGTKVTSTLTGENIGTGDFSVWVRAKIPESNPSAGNGFFGLSSSATTSAANGFGAFINSDGSLKVIIYGATTGDWRRAVFNSFRATYSGEVLDITITRSSTTLAVFANGVELTASSEETSGTAPAWSGSITSTYFNVGIESSTLLYSGSIYRSAVFNLALASSDIAEISASDIPYRFKWGSHADQTSGTLTVGKRYRLEDFIAGDDFSNIGATNIDGNEWTATGTTPTTWANSSIVDAIGAFVDLGFTEGLGFQARDKSTNNLHGTLSQNGVTWTRPNRRAQLVALDASSANGTLLASGYSLPARAIINNIVVRETAAVQLNDFYISTTAGSEAAAITVKKDVSASAVDSLQVIDTVSGGNAVEELFFNASNWGSGGTANITISYEIYE